MHKVHMICDFNKQEEHKMTAMERVCSFIKDAQTHYLATVDGDQPRV